MPSFIRYFLLLTGIGSMGFAMQSSEKEPAANPFKIRVQVDLSMVEVMATDKDGMPVRNLKKEDFRLFEEGKEQEILSADEVNAESELSPLGANLFDERTLHRSKTVLIVFDRSVNAQALITMRESAARFVKEHMRPQDIFAVANYHLPQPIVQNFTSNKEDVLQAIDRLAIANAGNIDISLDNLLRVFKHVIPSLAKIRGQKTVLFFAQPESSAYHNAQVSPMDKIQNPQNNAFLTTGEIYRLLNSFNSGSGAGTLDYTYRNTLDAARKANVVIYTIGDLRSQDSVISLSLRSFAAESGGLVITPERNLIDAELDKLDRQISNYYVLSYQSDNPKHDGSYRKLAIRTNANGVRLKYRESLPDRSPVDSLADDKKETSLTAALANPAPLTKLPVTFRPLYFYASPQEARVMVTGRIRLETMAFRKKDKLLGTDLSIMGVAYAENGAQAARFSETLPIRFDRKKEADYRKESFLYRNQFKLVPGKYRIKIVVADEANNLGSAEQFLEVPARSKHGLAASSLVIAEQASHLPDLIQNLEAQLLDENDPLLYADVQIEPSIVNKLAVESPIPVMFRLYKSPVTSASWNLTAKACLLNEKGAKFALDPIPIDKEIVNAGRGEVAVGLSLPFDNTPAGKYRLEVQISDTVSSETAMLHTAVELVPGAGNRMTTSKLVNKEPQSGINEEQTFTKTADSVSIAPPGNGVDLNQRPVRAKQRALPPALPKIKTIMDMSLEELKKHYSLGLNKDSETSRQEEMSALLEKIGKRVQEFFNNFSDTSSKEEVRLERRVESGIIRGEDTQTFNYLILPRSINNAPVFQEYRTDSKYRAIDHSKDTRFFITSGYSCLSILFHPVYHRNSGFRYLGRQPDGTYVIAFAQKPETGGYQFMYRGLNSDKLNPLPVQGVAWVDAGTWQIVRIRANLLPAGSVTSIKEQTTDVKFSEVRFDSASESVWLPLDVEVNIRVEGWWFRNLHHYSNYKLYSVKSDSKVTGIKSHK